MHSHDRTLLTRLGFADPDRKRPEHDRACRYLADQFEPLIALASAPRRKTWTDREYQMQRFKGGTAKTCPCPAPLTVDGRRYEHDDSDRAPVLYRTTRVSHEAACDGVTFEVPIHKGEGQYKTTIGFLDLRIPYDFDEVETGQYLRHPYTCWIATGGPDHKLPRTWEPYTKRHLVYGELLVEVKIAPAPIGDLLRQVKLYQEYYRADDPDVRLTWAIATREPLSAGEAQVLTDERILHLRLGQKFEAWMAAQDTTDSEPSQSPEI